VDARDLVVAVVLEPGCPQQGGVDGGGGVAALGQDADRLVGRIGKVLAHVEQKRGIEGIVLRVKPVASILDGDQLVLGKEGGERPRQHLRRERIA
jgi:hypothetical protein